MVAMTCVRQLRHHWLSPDEAVPDAGSGHNTTATLRNPRPDVVAFRVLIDHQVDRNQNGCLCGCVATRSY